MSLVAQEPAPQLLSQQVSLPSLQSKRIYVLPNSSLNLGVLNDHELGMLSPTSLNGNLLEVAGLPVSPLHNDRRALGPDGTRAACSQCVWSHGRQPPASRKAHSYSRATLGVQIAQGRLILKPDL